MQNFAASSGVFKIVFIFLNIFSAIFLKYLSKELKKIVNFKVTSKKKNKLSQSLCLSNHVLNIVLVSMTCINVLSWRSLKNIASLTYPVEKNGKNFALVSFRSIRDARRALNRLNGKEVAGNSYLNFTSHI